MAILIQGPCEVLPPPSLAEKVQVEFKESMQNWITASFLVRVCLTIYYSSYNYFFTSYGFVLKEDCIGDFHLHGFRCVYKCVENLLSP